MYNRSVTRHPWQDCFPSLYQELWKESVIRDSRVLQYYIGLRQSADHLCSILQDINLNSFPKSTTAAASPAVTAAHSGACLVSGLCPADAIVLMKLTWHMLSFLAGFLVSCALLLTHPQQQLASELYSGDHTRQPLPSSLHLPGPRVPRHLLSSTDNEDHSIHLPQWSRYYGGFKSRWHHTVLKSVLKAEQLLGPARKSRANRFFVPMLTYRHSEVCCMLTDLNKKVAGTNDLDVFVFSVDNAAQSAFTNSVCRDRKFNMTVNFMALDEHWKSGHSANPATSSSAFFDKKDWVSHEFNEEYRRMGHWRLAFQFAFADMLGYRYVWQIDDDFMFKAPLTYNMMEYMQKHDVWVGGMGSDDEDFVTWGLPEMVRLYLVAERMAPVGSLYNHTGPGGLQGLYSVVNETVRPANQRLRFDKGGWDKRVIHGNFVLIDMEKFWWPKPVQKFIELVLLSGYHFRFRWNEQGVFAMVWQMFVPDANAAVDTLPLTFVHPHKFWGTCPGGTSTD